MAVSATFSPPSPTHSAAYELMVSGLTPADTYTVYAGQAGVSPTALCTSKAADDNGNILLKITAQAGTGRWWLVVIDTTGGGNGVYTFGTGFVQA